MRNTIGQVKSAFNFRDAMDSGKVLLINLSKGKIGDLNTQLLGLIMVARIQMAAMGRADMRKEDRKDFYLYVDEFQNFATDSFCSILSEARKYRLALIMAHQYIKQLEKKGDTSIRDAVFGNVGTMMSLKVGADDAEYMAKEYAPVLTQADVLGIANYKWNEHPDRTIYTHGDLFLKPRDIAKIGYIMLNQGKWENKQIVSNAWIQESTREHIDTFWGYGYGYQWRCGKTLICDQEIEAFWASGTGGQKIYVFPKLDLVVVFTSKIFDNMYGQDRNESVLANFIIPAVVSPEYKRKVIKLDNTVLDTYVGEYKINQEKMLLPDFAKRMRLKVFREGSKLFFKLPDGQIVQLFPESKDLLFGNFKDIGQIQFRAIRDENGAIKHVTRNVGFRALLLDKVK